MYKYVYVGKDKNVHFDILPRNAKWRPTK